MPAAILAHPPPKPVPHSRRGPMRFTMVASALLLGGGAAAAGLMTLLRMRRERRRPAGVTKGTTGDGKSIRSQLKSDAEGSLSNVEKTALQVSTFRLVSSEILKRFSPTTWDPRYDSALVTAFCPDEAERARVLSEAATWGDNISLMMAARTAEIDLQLLAALGEQQGGESGGPAIRQVVIVGAGLDPRAWRLPWPAGTRIFEIDSGSAEGFKTRALGSYPISAASRSFIKMDLSEAGNQPAGQGEEEGGSLLKGGEGGEVNVLAASLKAAGFDSSAPCLWLVEGLIGYLSEVQGAHLLGAMIKACAPGSRMVMTCPPTPKVRSGMAATGRALHHLTFEEAEATLARVQGEGWEATLVTAEAIGAKWGMKAEDRKQAQILAIKPRSSTPQEATK